MNRVRAPGRLKVFLGAAAGVGKSFAMLGEARHAVEAGIDVVVGYLEAHGRRATEDREARLEVAPRRAADVGGRPWTDLDLDWLLARAPQLCLVDELAHTNLPGGRHGKRWQDVGDLLGAGIDVWTTVNIQHLESLNDKVADLTGVRVRETFPDRLLHEADEVVLIDLGPAELRERIAAGLVYTTDKIPAALTRFFTVEHLTGLRALALREVAELQERGPAPPEVEERVLVCVDGRPGSAGLVRRGARSARRAAGRLWVLHVEPETERQPTGVLAAVAEAEALGRALGATVVRRAGDAAAVIVEVARELAITQIVLGESHRSRWRAGRSVIAQVLRDTEGADVHVIADARARGDR